MAEADRRSDLFWELGEAHQYLRLRHTSVIQIRSWVVTVAVVVSGVAATTAPAIALVGAMSTVTFAFIEAHIRVGSGEIAARARMLERVLSDPATQVGDLPEMGLAQVLSGGAGGGWPRLREILRMMARPSVGIIYATALAIQGLAGLSGLM